MNLNEGKIGSECVIHVYMSCYKQEDYINM